LKNVMWLRRRCWGKANPTAPFRGQSVIIITRSGGWGNAGKRDGVASRVRGGERQNGFESEFETTIC
jgi:hypothetical protein